MERERREAFNWEAKQSAWIHFLVGGTSSQSAWDGASAAVGILSLVALVGPRGCETKTKCSGDQL